MKIWTGLNFAHEIYINLFVARYFEGCRSFKRKVKGCLPRESFTHFPRPIDSFAGFGKVRI